MDVRVQDRVVRAEHDEVERDGDALRGEAAVARESRNVLQECLGDELLGDGCNDHVRESLSTLIIAGSSASRVQ